MAGKKRFNGPTGRHVARNLKRLREDARLGYTELSASLERLGWVISPLALSRIEDEKPDAARAVTVDDIMALSIALGTSPLALLLPQSIENPTSDAGGVIPAATGADDLSAMQVWRIALADVSATPSDHEKNLKLWVTGRPVELPSESYLELRNEEMLREFRHLNPDLLKNDPALAESLDRVRAEITARRRPEGAS
jgi:hypothetical protein